MDGVSAHLEVDGVAEVLRALGKVNPELKKATVKAMKAAGDPMVQEARSLFPSATPLSNWGNWTTPKGRVIGPYNPSKVKRGVKVAYRGSKVKGSDKNQFLVVQVLSFHPELPVSVFFLPCEFFDFAPHQSVQDIIISYIPGLHPFAAMRGRSEAAYAGKFREQCFCLILVHHIGSQDQKSSFFDVTSNFS